MPILNMMTQGSGGGWWANIWEPSDLKAHSRYLDVTITRTDNNLQTIPPTAFQKSELIRKVGSAPTSPSDGDLVVTETVMNTYESTWYVDQGLTDGTTYYYRVFSYSDSWGVTYGEAVNVTPSMTWWQGDMDLWTLAQTSPRLSWLWWWWVFFNSDWTKIYLSRGASPASVFQSSLSNPYDLSSISFNDYINIKAEDIHFSPDWVYLFTLDNDNGVVNRFTLSTPRDITTAVQDQSTYAGDFRWLFFTNDGTKLYTSNHNGGGIYMNTLSTPWDLTTASSRQAITYNYWGLALWFSPDWKHYFAQQNENTNDLTYLEFSTPYDFNTIIDSGTKDIGNCRAWGIWFNENWTLCVMAGWGYYSNYVTKYTL